MEFTIANVNFKLEGLQPGQKIEFKAPIGETKKWFQFWKETKPQEVIIKLIPNIK